MLSRLGLLLPRMIHIEAIRPRVYTFHGNEPDRTLSTKAWSADQARQRFRDHMALATRVPRDRIHGWITT